MNEHAVSPNLPDAATEDDFRPTIRERLGITAFVIVAVVATASWIVVLGWGALQLIKNL